MKQQSTISRNKTSSRLLVLALPVVMVGMIQMGGCMRRTPPPPPPGGTYLSADGGITFEQQVMRAEPEFEGQHIANFTLGTAHRPEHDPRSIYIASETRGIVASTNNGRTWWVINTPLISTVNVIALPNDVLVASGTGPEGQGYIVRSINMGEDWEVVLTVPVPTSGGQFGFFGSDAGLASVVVAIAPDPFDSTRIYAGSNLGTIFAGEQSAQTWRTIYSLKDETLAYTQGHTGLAIDKIIPSPHQPDDYLIITRDRKFIRVTGGVESEIEVPKNIGEEPSFIHGFQTVDVYDAKFIPGFPDALLVGVENGVVVTNDSGQTWGKLSVPLDDTLQFRDVVVTVSPHNPNRFLVGFKNVLYRSEDAGQTWITYTMAALGVSGIIADISFDPLDDNNILVVTSPSRI